MGQNVEQLHIRKSHVSDSEGLVELVRKGMRGYPFESVYDLDEMRRSLQNPNDYRIVSVDETGRIVATAVLGDSGDYMQEIKRVVVDPDFRGRRVATSLTTYLTEYAVENGIVPWLDARGCQLGMQKAGFNAGYQALSLEIGKHCVYFHVDKETGLLEVGPGRETMVHMTFLKGNLRDLAAGLSQWPLDLVEILVGNMEAAFNPQPKKKDAIANFLPSASLVKKRIQSGLDRLRGGNALVNNLTGDISVVTIGDLTMVVVKPDASGFYFSGVNENLPVMVDLGQELGLQTMTAYIDVDLIRYHDLLRRAGLHPTMVRLDKEKDGPSTWQVGWRVTANGFYDCLHYVNLDRMVESQIKTLISQII